MRREIASRAMVKVTNVTLNNINQVRRLHQLLLPVEYSDDVYRVALEEDTRALCQLGLYNDVPVGTVCCRLEEGSNVTRWTLYVMTLCVLPAYRRLGVATALVKHVLEHAKPGMSFAGRVIESVRIHVHTDNGAARLLYESLGFQVVDEVSNYYPTLTPSSAWVLELRA